MNKLLMSVAGGLLLSVTLFTVNVTEAAAASSIATADKSIADEVISIAGLQNIVIDKVDYSFNFPPNVYRKPHHHYNGSRNRGGTVGNGQRNSNQRVGNSQNYGYHKSGNSSIRYKNSGTKVYKPYGR